MVKLLTLANQILHQIQYFLVVFLMSAPIDAVQIHVTGHCYINRQTCMSSQFVVTPSVFKIGVYMIQIRLVSFM